MLVLRRTDVSGLLNQFKLEQLQQHSQFQQQLLQQLHQQRQQLKLQLTDLPAQMLLNLLEMTPLAWKFKPEQKQSCAASSPQITLNFYLDLYRKNR